MICALLCCLYMPMPAGEVSLPFQTAEAPQGLRISRVVLEVRDDFSAKVTVTGRYSGFDKGRVYFDMTVKQGVKVLGTDRDHLDVVPRQKFHRVFWIKLSKDPSGARAHFKFGELYPR